MYKLSICIPTYNRSLHLRNCLNSIAVNNLSLIPDVQVCVSDNCSPDQTQEIVNDASQSIPIKYSKNETNIGLAGNILKVVEMADGEFVWLIGDDDMLMPNAFEEMVGLIKQYKDVDFFFVNSAMLSAEYVLSFPQPFSLSNLPQKMDSCSTREISGVMDFLDLIDPRIRFDFLGGIFLSVFRREKWTRNVDVLDTASLSDPQTFSHFDNTFPHIKIFAKAFSHSKAYFCAKRLSVCLSGVREWGAMYPLVKSVRLIEALKEYQKNGLSLLRYVVCKNAALNSFALDFIRMILDKEKSGYAYVNPVKIIAANLMYPGFYLSFFSPFFKRSFWKKILYLTIPSCRK